MEKGKQTKQTIEPGKQIRFMIVALQNKISSLERANAELQASNEALVQQQKVHDAQDAVKRAQVATMVRSLQRAMNQFKEENANLRAQNTYLTKQSSAMQQWIQQSRRVVVGQEAAPAQTVREATCKRPSHDSLYVMADQSNQKRLKSVSSLAINSTVIKRVSWVMDDEDHNEANAVHGKGCHQIVQPQETPGDQNHVGSSPQWLRPPLVASTTQGHPKTTSVNAKQEEESHPGAHMDPSLDHLCVVASRRCSGTTGKAQPQNGPGIDPVHAENMKPASLEPSSVQEHCVARVPSPEREENNPDSNGADRIELDIFDANNFSDMPNEAGSNSRPVSHSKDHGLDASLLKHKKTSPIVPCSWFYHVYECPCGGCAKNFRFVKNAHLLPRDAAGCISDSQIWPRETFRGELARVRKHLREMHPEWDQSDWPVAFAYKQP